jgi:hypothetical protein
MTKQEAVEVLGNATVKRKELIAQLKMERDRLTFAINSLEDVEVKHTPRYGQLQTTLRDIIVGFGPEGFSPSELIETAAELGINAMAVRNYITRKHAAKELKRVTSRHYKLQ